MEITSKPNVDLMLRTAHQYHAHLIAMADTKASIVITVCSIIATFSMGQAKSPHLKWGLITLSLFCVLSLILAILAIMPRIQLSKRLEVDVHAPMFNILFFGHFMAMKYEAFESRLEEIISSDREVYRTQMRDVYGLGIVLVKKYQFLKMSYMCFMNGFMISILLVALSYIFF